jgi:N-acyl-L-homoserine lactone synthetase
MINALNYETAHLHGNAFAQLLKLRHAEFVARLNYNVPTYNGMEYDQYDTPAAVYMVWRDLYGNVRAGSRMCPTTRPYMLKELWPQSIRYMDLPCSHDVWEITRLFVDRTLEEPSRRQAHGELLCAYIEFALRNGINTFIGCAPPRLWKHTMIKCGWPVEFVGDVTEINESEKIQAGIVRVSLDALQNIRATMEISGPVLDLENDLPMEKAA